jgi:hypothetical protein
VHFKIFTDAFTDFLPIFEGCNLLSMYNLQKFTGFEGCFFCALAFVQKACVSRRLLRSFRADL